MNSFPGCLQKLKEHHKANVKRMFESVSGGVSNPGKETLLNDIFTDVWITEVAIQHDDRQTETGCKSTVSQIRSLTGSDIFKSLPGQAESIRTVLTKGIAGSGKTLCVKKILLDWAHGTENQEFDFIYYLPFCELNLFMSEISLLELIQSFFPVMVNLGDALDCCKVLFIFDGLNESRFPLEFETNRRCSDVKQPTAVDVLLTSLIQGSLLGEASIWITSRPAAASLIPLEHISRATEIQGFQDEKKEEYIRKKCRNADLADRIISNLKMQRSLYILCQVPVFCWIVVTVLEHTLEETCEDQMTSLTAIYTKFIVLLLRTKKEKAENVLKSNREAILKLGKLAFEHLEKKSMFFDTDLKDCGIDSTNSFFSRVCKEIFQQNLTLFQGRVYTFVHLTVQEYFAALYIFFSENHNLSLPKKLAVSFSSAGSRKSIFSLNAEALEQAAQSRNGHLDLVVRFLLGMGMEKTQALLKGFLSSTEDHSSDIQKTVEHIRDLIKQTSSAERCFSLLYYLSELNYKSLMDEFDAFLYSGKLSGQIFTPSQCSELAYFFSVTENTEIVLTRCYTALEENVRRLIPFANTSEALRVWHCEMGQTCCEDLASVLQSPRSALRDLDLSSSNLGAPGVALLSAALRAPSCKLKVLWLPRCGVTHRCCEDLASVLQSQHSSLEELDLSFNDVGDSGVKLLSAALRDPNCKLKTLWCFNQLEP